MTKREAYINAYEDMRYFWEKMERSKFFSEWNESPYGDHFLTYIEKYFENSVPEGCRFRTSIYESEHIFLSISHDKSLEDGLDISSSISFSVKENDSNWPCILNEKGRIDVVSIKKEIQKKIDYLDKRIGILKNFDPQKMIELHGQLENEIKAWDKTIPFEFSEFKIFED